MSITSLIHPVRTKAERGARFLDRRQPGWFLRVNTKNFNMEDGRHCVIGQLFGVFEFGRRELGLSRRQVVRLGFYIPLFGLTRTTDYYRALTKAWVQEIETRLEQYHLARIEQAVKQIERRAARMAKRNASLNYIEMYANQNNQTRETV